MEKWFTGIQSPNDLIFLINKPDGERRQKNSRSYVKATMRMTCTCSNYWDQNWSAESMNIQYNWLKTIKQIGIIYWNIKKIRGHFWKIEPVYPIAILVGFHNYNNPKSNNDFSFADTFRCMIVGVYMLLYTRLYTLCVNTDMFGETLLLTFRTCEIFVLVISTTERLRSVCVDNVVKVFHCRRFSSGEVLT
jgi:hypothetical protein